MTSITSGRVSARRVAHAARRDPRRMAIIALALLLAAIGLAGLSLASIIRANLLNEAFYARALDRNRVYDRVYEDLLADPEIAAEINRVLGINDYQRTIAVSTLRTLFPPDVLEEQVENGLLILVDYLSGRRDELAPQINLGAVPEDVRDASVMQVLTRLAELPEERSPDDQRLVQAIQQTMASLAGREVPERLPAGNVTPFNLRTLATVILSPVNRGTREAIQEQIIAHLTVNDIRGAVAVALPAILDSTGDRGDGFLQTASLEYVQAQLDEWGGRIGSALIPLRSLIAATRGWLFPASIGALAFAWVVIFSAVRGHPVRRLMAASASIALLAGALSLVFALGGEDLIGLLANRNLDQREIAALPASVQDVVADVRHSLVADVTWTVTRTGLLVAGAGAAGIAAGGIALLISRLRHIRISRPALIVRIAGVAMLAISGSAPLALKQIVEAQADPCNGHYQLCERRYDEVAFPATHNAMSNSADGWFFPFHDVGISGQLEAGVRAFLIDTHIWSSADVFLEELSQRDDFSPEAAAYLSTLAGRFTEVPDGVFLCHSTCWLGATPIDRFLEQIRAFSEAHPREVITLIIQDDAAQSEIVAAFERTGLADLAYEHESGEPWPTLGELIETQKTVVVFAERGGPPPGWYHHAWDYIQDTRFDFRSSDDLDCLPNRGSPDNPLLLVNHWISKSSPDRLDATALNSFESIMTRVSRCEEARGTTPNFIAVDFFHIGDLLRAVGALNGFGVSGDRRR